jgi:23S rRNA pseudouridine2605 synthase
MASPKTKKTVKSKKTAPLKPESKKANSASSIKGKKVATKSTPEGDARSKPRKKPAKSTPVGRDGFQPIHLSQEEHVDAEVKKETLAEAQAQPSPEPQEASEPEFTPEPRPPAKLERLQKILAAAGVASRRSAEAMIEQGRVQVNGKIVTVLGTKADALRDHIRVDGKLLQGPERHRYFVLNKPRGFVTTVKDPEGRPTVMQFFDKMKERLYPVGRLDYLSEGLLLVTNDGELANRLTKASSGVEKTYLVKVAGQPTEAELNILRGGVVIERGKPGSPPVRTSPARIRQVRQGDNPWYEVVLVEGRNRELRKMFEEIGHFVEKIRRVGYGPLVLDQEPGNLRELQPEELAALRRAAEGTLRTPKSKELRRRNLLDAGLLPTVLPKPTSRPSAIRQPERFAPAADRPSNFRPKKFGSPRPTRPADSFASGEANKLFRPARPGARPAARPAWKKDERPNRPPARFAVGSTGESRPGAGRPFTPKPAWKKPERPAPPRREAPVRETRVFDEDLGPVRPPNLHIEEITGPDRPSVPRASYSRPSFARPARGEGGQSRPFSTSSGKPRAGGARPSSKPFKPGFSKSGAPADRSSSVGWKRGPARPFTTSNGKPRADGARPSWMPRPNSTGKPASSSSRPFTPRTEGSPGYRPNKAKPYPNSASRAERKAGPGWKPKPGGFSKSGVPTDRPSSVGWKSGYKSKPSGSGPKRTGPRPFANRPGGKSGTPADRSSSVGWKRTGGFSGGKKRG